MSMLSEAVLTGRDDGGIDYDSLERPVHRELISAWSALRSDALAAGFDLALASGYRDYERQLRIWNDKATGRRQVLDSHGAILDSARLAPEALMWAILRWSALPGASRHHWGTDVDVYDRAAVPADYQLRLVPAEVANDGPFGALHRWLDERIAAGRSHGFFRPYGIDRGGVAPERWHLSYAPLAVLYQRCQAPDRLWAALDNPALALRDCIHAYWMPIFERYIAVPASCYPRPWRDLLSGRDDQLSAANSGR